MRVMLTSCGLETEQIKEQFLRMLGKAPADAKALFIPTAAIDADAIEVLPECMRDLLKCGIPKENIRVFDLHRNMPVDELKTYDVLYLTGGSTSYLLERINDTGFRNTLLTYIRDNGFVIGVSAGSLIFAQNLPGNLELLDTKLDVHCEASSHTGRVFFPPVENVKLSNTAAMLIRSIPDDAEIIDG
ncbi:MAG: Type 1 glutamine amidotransferase-like domain-containing protein [Clostridia bacterium]|nr:Type 1 glutamine amidotransferase-like domain-containing protein [Clostridia bacterium]